MGLVTGRNGGPCRCRGAARRLERLDAALDRRQRPAQVRLQLLELLEGVVLGLPHDLLGAALGVAHDLLRLSLGAPEDLLLGHDRLRLLVGAGDDPAGLAVGLGDQPLLLGDRPVGLFDLLREVEAELVDDVHDVVFVDRHAGREGDPPGVVDQALQPIEQLVDLYWNFSFRRLATAGGTKSLTSLP